MRLSFTPAHDAVIRDLWLQDVNCLVIADRLGRKFRSVITRAHKLGLPVRRRGVRPYMYLDLKAMQPGDVKFMTGCDVEEAQRIRTAMAKTGNRYRVLKRDGGYLVERLGDQA